MTASSLWRIGGQKILASKSAARLALFEAAALPVLVRPAELDERAMEAQFFAEGGKAPGLARRLAGEKALAASRAAPDALVFGADQTLTLSDKLLHKAANRAEAADRLKRLAGRRHRLTSAVAVARGGALLAVIEDRAELTVRALGPRSVDAYLEAAGEDALHSVGGYRLEGVGIHLFSRIVGAHETVLGLPLLPLLAWLRDEDMIGP